MNQIALAILTVGFSIGNTLQTHFNDAGHSYADGPLSWLAFWACVFCIVWDLA